MTERGNRRHQGADPHSGQDQSGDTAWDAVAANLAGLSPPGDIPAWAIRPGATLPAGTRQVVFIDSAVPDAQLLASGVGPGVIAVILTGGTDGVDQIAAWLAAHGATGLSAIDIVAHGQDGMITLGNATLASGNIAPYAAALAAIGAALRTGGDLQLYGCDIAQDAPGVAFLSQLSAATGGAHVAAASHLVGGAAGGGSWNLDVNTGAIDTAAPFTAAAISGYADELGLTTNQLFAGYQGPVSSSFSRIEEVGVTGSTDSNTTDLIDDSGATNFQNIVGIAIDAPTRQYFVVDNSDGVNPGPSGTDNILEGTIGGGLHSIFNAPTSSPADYSIGGLALDQPDGYLYFGYGSDIIPAGIYRINIATDAVTAVATSSNVLVPGAVSLDLADNLVFFTDTDSDNQNKNNIDVGNIGSGGVTILNGQLSSSLQSLLSVSNGNEGFLSGLAYDAATKTLFFTTVDGNVANNASDGIFSVPVTVSGGTVTLGAVTTLYSGNAADAPISLALDTQNNLFYIGSANAGSSSGIFESSMSGGGLHLVYQETSSTSSFGQPYALALLSTPTIAATGSLSYIENAAAADLDAGATVSNADGQELDGATVSIAGGSAADGDTLTATLTGTSIVSSYNAATEVLTLAGVDTLADYQRVLDGLRFSSTGATGGLRTIDWSVTDGVITSATATSEITVHDAPVVVAGGTIIFTGGGSAVVLDAGLSVTDSSSSTLSSATVVIGGFIAGDTLTVGSAGGLGSSFSNGTLTLSGNASLATYKTALDSIAYGFAPSNGDPTGGGSHTSRTISWSTNDGFLSSAAADSTLTVIHAHPTVTAGAAVNYNVGSAAVTLDPGVAVSDPDSGGILTGATVSVAGGSGDTLAVGSTAGIAASYNPTTETLTLSGSDTIAHYQAELAAVSFASTGSGSRSIDWTVNDGVATSATATSTVNLVSMPTVVAGASVTFNAGGMSPLALDSGLSLSDPSATTLTGATVSIGGFLAGDTLLVSTAGGLTAGFNNGTLTLTGSASLATYQTALESVGYLFSPSTGDPTEGGADDSRTIAWAVKDANGNASAAATSTLELHIPPTVVAGASVTYPENAAPLALDPALAVTDPDSGGNLSGATVTISSGFLAGDTLTWSGAAGIAGSYDSGTGVLTFTGTASIASYQSLLQSVAYSFAGDPTNHLADNNRTISWTVTDGTGSSTAVTSSLTVLCFCAGTMIATPDGEMAVERLSAGDMVLTASGAARPIIWVGVGRQLVTRGRRSAATPVVVAKHALGPNVPRADLHLTKAHALLVDDVLIPVEFLVNHRSIRWDDRAQEVSLYHIELESHDVLVANGAPAESYRDDGNRWLFQNARAGWGASAGWDQAPCAPVLTGGPVVDAAWKRYLDMSGPRKLPPLTEDPDLHLVVDGKRVDPVRCQGQDYMFRLPRGFRTVRIVSRDAIPGELGLVRDPRPLGVALRSITLEHGAKFVLIAAEDHRLSDGFHGYEPAEGLRWTNGNAGLPDSIFTRFGAGAEMVVTLGGSTRYPLCGEAGRSAAA